jgi:surfactin synthase thioesterase subunit
MKKAQLFFLHFAGGSVYSFNAITSRLKDISVIPIELPGRGRRIQERLLQDFDMAATDLFNQIVLNLNGAPFLIYGHSMGAYLGLRVSNMLESVGRPPSYLIVSGNAGPGIKSEGAVKRYLLGKEAFIEELKTLGGVPEQVFHDPELFNFFEPILRADFQIVETNELANEPAVAAPLYALMGSEEKNVDQIANWGRFTHSDFCSEILEGNHFFIHKHASQVAQILRGLYELVAAKERSSYYCPK